MNDKTFVDSNSLIYAHDIDAGEKYLMARRSLDALWANASGALSPQVLQEFYVDSTRKIAKPLSRRVACEVVYDFSAWCVETTNTEVSTAFHIEDEAKISFWDALILSSALKAGAAIFLSEDMNGGQKIAGIRIVNPFLS